MSECESRHPQTDAQCMFQRGHIGPHMRFEVDGEGEDAIYPHWAWGMD